MLALCHCTWPAVAREKIDITPLPCRQIESKAIGGATSSEDPPAPTDGNAATAVKANRSFPASTMMFYSTSSHSYFVLKFFGEAEMAFTFNSALLIGCFKALFCNFLNFL